MRRVWELDPDGFRWLNQRWNELVTKVVDDVQQALGLEDRKLVAQLYKLLLYEEGDFFLPHRDGEKQNGMVATLVIGLPSIYEGGELIVSHEDKQHEIVFTGAASGYELSYAAFYANCEHEIRPLRSGYRLCLVYNLTLAKSRSKKGLSAPSYSGTAVAIGQLFRDHATDGASQKRVVALQHRYTQNGLTLDKLKGIDRAWAQVLFEATEQTGWVAHLALMTFWQCGTAEGDYDYGYNCDYDLCDRERGHGPYTTDDEALNGCKYEMGEVFDDSLSVNHWSDHQGKKVRLGEMSVEESEIISETPPEDWDPSSEEFEGYTGNAGMTLERWYHRAAIAQSPH